MEGEEVHKNSPNFDGISGYINLNPDTDIIVIALKNYYQVVEDSSLQSQIVDPVEYNKALEDLNSLLCFELNRPWKNSISTPNGAEFENIHFEQINSEWVNKNFILLMKTPSGHWFYGFVISYPDKFIFVELNKGPFETRSHAINSALSNILIDLSSISVTEQNKEFIDQLLKETAEKISAIPIPEPNERKEKVSARIRLRKRKLELEAKNNINAK